MASNSIKKYIAKLKANENWVGDNASSEKSKSTNSDWRSEYIARIKSGAAAKTYDDEQKSKALLRNNPGYVYSKVYGDGTKGKAAASKIETGKGNGYISVWDGDAVKRNNPGYAYLQQAGGGEKLTKGSDAISAGDIEWYKKILRGIDVGLTDFSKSLVSTADVVTSLGDEDGGPLQELWYMFGGDRIAEAAGDNALGIKGLNFKDNPIKAFNKLGEKEIEYRQKRDAAYADNPLYKYSAATSEAAAMMASTLMGGGLATAVDTAALANAARIGQAASKLSQTGAIAQNAIKQFATRPDAQVIFGSSFGSSYDEAKQDGADDLQALVYAALNGAGNAVTELGGVSELGGLQKLPEWVKKAVNKGDKSLLLNYAKSIGEEASEEIIQGILGRGLKSIYSDVPLYDANDENSIINPKAAIEEATGAAVVSTLLGLPTTGINAAYRAKQRGETGQRLYGNSQRELVDEGLESERGTKSYELARKYDEKLNNGKQLSGNELYRLAQANEKAQVNEGTAVQSAPETQLNEESPALPYAALNREQQLSELRNYVAQRSEMSAPVNTNVSNNEAVSKSINNVAAKIDATPEFVSRVYNLNPVASPKAFETAFNAVYQMGQQGTDKESLTKVPVLNRAQAEIAYNMGASTTQAAVDNAAVQGDNVSTQVNNQVSNAVNNAIQEVNENGVRIHNVAERINGQNTEGQIRGVETGTGENVAGGSQKEQGGAGAAQIKAGEKVSYKGKRQKGVYYAEEDTEDMKKGRKLAESYGYKVTYFVGGNIRYAGGEFRGAVDTSNKTVMVRADHPDYTAEQIMRHEMGHAAFENGDLSIDEAREMLLDEFTADEINELIEIYNSEYGGILSAEEAFEEICCDALGRMNIFEGTDLNSESYGKAQDTVRKYAADKTGSKGRAPPKGGVKYSYEGKNKYGIEVYETSDEVKALSRKERQKKFLEIMQNEYRGRTAKFIRNGHAYYATFDGKDINKNIYGDKRSSNGGYNAKLKVGADGNIFELVENAKYNGSEKEIGKSTKAHRQIQYWDYYVKTVQIDNQVYDLVANVRRKSTGDFVYSIQLRGNNTIEASAAQQPNQKVGVNKAANASKGSIPNTSENVKKYSAEPTEGTDAKTELVEKQTLIDANTGKYIARNINGEHFGLTDDPSKAITEARDIERAWASTKFMRKKGITLETATVTREVQKREPYHPPKVDSAQRTQEKQRADDFEQSVKGSYFYSHSRKNLTPYYRVGNDVIINRTAAIELFVRAAKKMGALERHHSSRNGSKYSSSVYLVLDGTELRISDHELPYNAIRDNTRTRWDGEIILDDYTLREMVKLKSEKEYTEWVKECFESPERSDRTADYMPAFSREPERLNELRRQNERKLAQATAEDAANENERGLIRDYQKQYSKVEDIREKLSAAQQALTEAEDSGADYDTTTKAKNRFTVLSNQYAREHRKLESYAKMKALQNVLTRVDERLGNDLPEGMGAASANFTGEETVGERWVTEAQGKGGSALHPISKEQEANLAEQQQRAPQEIPKEDLNGKLTSKHVSTIANSGMTPAEFSDALREDAALGKFSHIAYSDEEALKKANRTIEIDGWEQALANYKAEINSGRVSKDNTVMGIALYNNAVNSGDYATAMDIASLMVKNSTNTAQSLQAMRILNKLSPECRLYLAAKSIENIEEDLNERYKDNKADIHVDKILYDEYAKALRQGNEDGIKTAWANIEQSVAQQIDATWYEKLNNFRYLAMLGNPRTHVRNIVGNAFFVPVRAVKNTIAYGLENIADAKINGGIERSKAILNSSNAADAALVKYAMSDYEAVQEVILSGGKYVDTFQGIDKHRTIYKTKILEAARKGNSAALDAEDAWFCKPAYANALAKWYKANGITAEQLNTGKVPEETIIKAQTTAIKEAQKATYRDTNWFSAQVSRLGKVDNKVAAMLIEGVLPFKKTPANILARAVEYSPVGLIKSLALDTKKVKAYVNGDIENGMSPAEFIDDISAGLTGSALMGLGILLASWGVLSGGDDDDEKQNYFDELSGKQNYALSIGGMSITLDWLAPESMPLFVGVELFNSLSSKNEDKGFLQNLMSSVMSLSTPMFEMSMLQSVNDLFDNLAYIKQGQGTFKIVSSMAANYISQYFPTLFGQGERAFGETQRETTYVDRNSAVGSELQYMWGKIANKIPFYDFSQIPYIDAWGRTEETGNLFERMLNNFVNPAYVKKERPTEIDGELERLYDLGETSVYPSRAKTNTKINGEYLTADEYVKYATTKGQTSYELAQGVINSAAYSGAADPEKAYMLKYVYSYADHIAKYEVNNDYSLAKWEMAAYKSANPMQAIIDHAREYYNPDKEN